MDLVGVVSWWFWFKIDVFVGIWFVGFVKGVVIWVCVVDRGYGYVIFGVGYVVSVWNWGLYFFFVY